MVILTVKLRLFLNLSRNKHYHEWMNIYYFNHDFEQTLYYLVAFNIRLYNFGRTKYVCHGIKNIFFMLMITPLSKAESSFPLDFRYEVHN